MEVTVVTGVRQSEDGVVFEMSTLKLPPGAEVVRVDGPMQTVTLNPWPKNAGSIDRLIATPKPKSPNMLGK